MTATNNAKSLTIDSSRWSNGYAEFQRLIKMPKIDLKEVDKSSSPVFVPPGVYSQFRDSSFAGSYTDGYYDSIDDMLEGCKEHRFESPCFVRASVLECVEIGPEQIFWDAMDGHPEGTEDKCADFNLIWEALEACNLENKRLKAGSFVQADKIIILDEGRFESMCEIYREAGK